jgi:hypothetical protein
VPNFRHVTIAAATVADAIAAAIANDDDPGEWKLDYESARPPKATGAWIGENAYRGVNLMALAAKTEAEATPKPAPQADPGPPTPRSWMTALDREGKAYWLTDLRIGSFYYGNAKFDVLDHGDDWLLLCEVGSGDPVMFLNMAQVIGFKIVEG